MSKHQSKFYTLPLHFFSILVFTISHFQPRFRAVVHEENHADIFFSLQCSKFFTCYFEFTLPLISFDLYYTYILNIDFYLQTNFFPGNGNGAELEVGFVGRSAAIRTVTRTGTST